MLILYILGFLICENFNFLICMAHGIQARALVIGSRFTVRNSKNTILIILYDILLLKMNASGLKIYYFRYNMNWVQ